MNRCNKGNVALTIIMSVGLLVLQWKASAVEAREKSHPDEGVNENVKPDSSQKDQSVQSIGASDVMLEMISHVEYNEKDPIDVIQAIIAKYNQEQAHAKSPLSLIVASYPGMDEIRPKPVKMKGSLSNIPLGEAIRILASSVGYSFMIADNHRIILLENALFRNPCTSGMVVSNRLGRALAGKEQMGAAVIDLREWFWSQGVLMDADAEALYYPKIKYVKMKNNCREIQLMEAVLRLAERMEERK